MIESAAPGFNPYATTPGSSTPGVGVSPEEGRRELWAFTWLAIANTTIISVVGIVVWIVVH